MIYLNCDNEEVRRQVEVCQLKGKRVLNPIIDWTEDEVWNFIRKYHLPYCCLYDQGFCRIGCIGCPLASTKTGFVSFSVIPVTARRILRPLTAWYRPEPPAENPRETGKTGKAYLTGGSMEVLSWKDR